MKGLVIGASSDAIHAIQVAKKMGVKTVAIDGNPSAKGLEYADEKYIIDISDVESVKEFVRKIKPDFLIPIPIGKMLSVAGEINEEFGF